MLAYFLKSLIKEILSIFVTHVLISKVSFNEVKSVSISTKFCHVINVLKLSNSIKLDLKILKIFEMHCRFTGGMFCNKIKIYNAAHL